MQYATQPTTNRWLRRLIILGTSVAIGIVELWHYSTHPHCCLFNALFKPETTS
jgi:hypothetical protein